MPEEVEIETKELQETLQELHEEREERQAEEKRTAWTRYIALSTAILAVVAAVAALESGSLVNEALIDKQGAVLKQTHASDQYAYYQAKGIKGLISSTVADALVELGKNGKVVTRLRTEQNRYKGEQDALKKQAEADEAERDKLDRESGVLLEHHHQFAIVVTLTQVAIALSAIAALTRRKPVWFGSLLLGAAGVALFLEGLLVR